MYEPAGRDFSCSPYFQIVLISAIVEEKSDKDVLLVEMIFAEADGTHREKMAKRKEKENESGNGKAVFKIAERQ